MKTKRANDWKVEQRVKPFKTVAKCKDIVSHRHVLVISSSQQKIGEGLYHTCCPPRIDFKSFLRACGHIFKRRRHSYFSLKSLGYYSWTGRFIVASSVCHCQWWWSWVSIWRDWQVQSWIYPVSLAGLVSHHHEDFDEDSAFVLLQCLFCSSFFLVIVGYFLF